MKTCPLTLPYSARAGMLGAPEPLRKLHDTTTRHRHHRLAGKPQAYLEAATAVWPLPTGAQGGAPVAAEEALARLAASFRV